MKQRRIIKTAGGKTYSGPDSDFVDRGEYIEYNKNFFTTEKIYKKTIIYESNISILTLTKLAVILLMLIPSIIIGGPRLFKIYNDNLSEKERVDKLIEQASILPLINYIDKYQYDKNKLGHIERVKVELNLICDKELRREQTINNTVNQNLKDSYQIDCPTIIEKF